MRHRVQFGEWDFPSISDARDHVNAFMRAAEDGELVPPDVMDDWMLSLIHKHPDAVEILSPQKWTGQVIVRTFSGRKPPTARLVMHDTRHGNNIEQDISLMKCIKNSVAPEWEPWRQVRDDDEATSTGRQQAFTPNFLNHLDTPPVLF